jgi:tRNA 2-thiouridine synthesizing protein C
MSEPIHIVVICRQAPYGSTLAREAIEFCLAAGAFGQRLSVVFMGDGVYQLLADQAPVPGLAKNHAKLIQSLPLYDIEVVYAEQQSLEVRQLDTAALLENAAVVDHSKISQIIDSADKVLSF